MKSQFRYILTVAKFSLHFFRKNEAKNRLYSRITIAFKVVRRDREE